MCREAFFAALAAIVADSEFNITLFAQEQAWRGDQDLGEDVKSLWTATACCSEEPGRVFGLPFKLCDEEQFLQEVKAQIFACEALDRMVREANGGRGLSDLEILHWRIWHEWQLGPEGARGRQPKWVTSTSTQPVQPGQRTSLPNLLLAGSHTRTEADVWSIEGAAESGRRAARAIDPRVGVCRQTKPLWMRLLSRADDVLYRLRAPQILDLMLGCCVVGLAGLALERRRRASNRLPPGLYGRSHLSMQNADRRLPARSVRLERQNSPV